MPKREKPEKLTLDKLRELIHKSEASDPLVFLEAIMSGQDPRKISKVYEKIIEIDQFTDGKPEKEDWSEVVDFVLQHNKYKEVSLSDSRLAANTLAEYLYPKRKNSDNSSESNKKEGEINSSLELTEEEIVLFKEKFNEEF